MKYIVITGVSTGIGFETTKFLIEQDYFVFGSVRKEVDAQKCSEAFGQSFVPLVFDVRDLPSIHAAVKKVKDKIGDSILTALINNAGIAVSGPLQHIPSDDIQAQFDINVIGLINTTQAFLPLLGGHSSNTKSPGRIVNISSVAGTFTMPFQTPYAASKHAVESITLGMRRELSIYGIKVVSIRPGPIKSDIWSKELAKAEDKYDGTAYARIWQRKNKIIAAKEREAEPTIKVSQTILKAIVSPKPKNHYLVYRKKLSYYLVRLIPTRLLDNIFAKQLKKQLT